MATTIRCDIVSAEAEIFHGTATLVVASGDEGELGIAPRHAPLITRLKPGQVRVIGENGEEQSRRSCRQPRQGRGRAPARPSHRRSRDCPGPGRTRPGHRAAAGDRAPAQADEALTHLSCTDSIGAGHSPAFLFRVAVHNAAGAQQWRNRPSAMIAGELPAIAPEISRIPTWVCAIVGA